MAGCRRRASLFAGGASSFVDTTAAFSPACVIQRRHGIHCLGCRRRPVLFACGVSSLVDTIATSSLACVIQRCHGRLLSKTCVICWRRVVILRYRRGVVTSLCLPTTPRYPQLWLSSKARVVCRRSVVIRRHHHGIIISLCHSITPPAPTLALVIDVHSLAWRNGFYTTGCRQIGVRRVAEVVSRLASRPRESHRGQGLSEKG